ncbi:HD domain-containing protein [bacterium]|nr:HD domain-containing protein [bacterium]
MTEKEVERLYKKYKTPEHIMKHCKKVDFVADRIAKRYLEKGVKVDYKNLHFACLLHDVVKILDFDPQEKSDHSKIAYLILIKLGEPIIANMIKKHAFRAIIEKENLPFTLEEKIMTYADKRVLHTNIVSLEERFKDGQKRYNPNNDNQKEQSKIYDAYFKLEKELFKPFLSKFI